MKKSIHLDVAESVQEDIDKGIARLPNSIFEVLALVSGDAVEIKAKNKIVVRALRPLKIEKKDVIRIDGTIRSNIGASIGDTVEITPVHVVPAQSVTLAPLQDVRFSNDPTEYFHNKLLDIPVVVNQRIVIDVFGTRLGYVVSEIPYAGDMKSTGVTYEDIGGLKNEIELVREMVELPMKHPEVFQKLGVGAPKGVLLTGPPGTG